MTAIYSSDTCQFIIQRYKLNCSETNLLYSTLKCAKYEIYMYTSYIVINNRIINKLFIVAGKRTHKV
jgi:hypothetical protein